MKILRITAYYDPELVSSSHLGKDLEEAFVNAGFVTERIVPTPTRNIDSETRKKYKKIKYESKYDGKVIIRRFSMFPEKKNTILRAVRYILSNIIQYCKGVKVKDADVVMCSSTPPTQGVFSAKIAKKLSKKYKRKIPFIYVLQDVFPASLVTTGLAKNNSFVYKIGMKISNYIYKNADAIIVISKDIENLLLKLDVPKEKIHLIPNWIDTEKVKPVDKEVNLLHKELSLSNDTFKIVYAGNLGKAQGIETLLNVAKLLVNNSNIEFLIFGKGTEEEKLKQKASSENITNVHFFPFQPLERVKEVYSLGDCCVICCKQGTGDAGVPSKTWSIISCARPLIVSFDKESDLYKTVMDNNIGLCAEAGDEKQLAEQIIKLYSDSLLVEKLGKNAREYAINNADKKIMTNKYVNLVKDICNDKETDLN